MDRQIAALSRIVMHQQVSRYDSARGGAGKVDEFDALVEMTDGVDSLASLKHNGRPCASGAVRGAWSFGEFSAVLRISREALEGQSAGLAVVSDPAQASIRVSFHDPASSARWFVAVDGRTYWLDFQGEIQASATGEVQRVSWVSSPPAAQSGIRQVQRTVSFAPMVVGGETFILPEYAEYRVIHWGNRVEWNTIRFGKPARYGSLVSVQFEQ
jgi:hypothetical protein